MTREDAGVILGNSLVCFGNAPVEATFEAKYDEVCGALQMAVSALREQEERSKGCEYCDGSEKCFLVDDEIPFGSYNSIRIEDGKAFLDDADCFRIRINFCPMCGRKLGERGDERC